MEKQHGEKPLAAESNTIINRKMKNIGILYVGLTTRAVHKLHRHNVVLTSLQSSAEISLEA